MKKPLVAIVGRPNVGKSTLFNRIAGGRSAIVEDHVGITRDRNYATASWQDRHFLLVDTGGIVPGSGEEMLEEIERQAMIAVKEADLILFLLDGRTGLMQSDLELSRKLRTSGKPVLYLVNKVDGPRQEEEMVEFYSLAPDELHPLSALHGRGLDDLMDRIAAILPVYKPETEATEIPRLAVVGKPNTGKSTLINSLMGKERMIVSPVAGTTRDSIDIECVYHGKKYLFIDTAGLRKKSRVDNALEYYSVVRTMKSIDRADVVLIMIDATQGFTEQDQKIAGMVHDAGKGALVLINKWDIAERKESNLKRLTGEIRNSAWFLKHAAILSISALTRQRITRIFPMIDAVMTERTKRITTAKLNDFIQNVTKELSPPLYRGRPIKVQYMAQVEVSPPTFTIFANNPAGLTPAYLRFLERRLREEFGFEGTPVRMFVKPRKQNQSRR